MFYKSLFFNTQFQCHDIRRKTYIPVLCFVVTTLGDENRLMLSDKHSTGVVG